MSVRKGLPSLLNNTYWGVGLQRRGVHCSCMQGGKWEWRGEKRWRWREDWKERQREEVEQVKRMCEERMQAIVRVNEASVERVKMMLQAMVIEAEAMAMVERVEMKHEKENMAREEKEMEGKRIFSALRCLTFEIKETREQCKR